MLALARPRSPALSVSDRPFAGAPGAISVAASAFIARTIIGTTGDETGITTSKRVNVIGDRYAEILRRERIEKQFSEAEWNALRDMLNGTLSEPAELIRGSLAMGWEDSVEDGLAETVAFLRGV